MKLEDLGSELERHTARRLVRNFNGSWILTDRVFRAIQILFDEVKEDLPLAVQRAHVFKETPDAHHAS